MRQGFNIIAIICFLNGLSACSGKKETARSIMTRWCELNTKVDQTTGPAKQDAIDELRKFEHEMDRKYHRTDPIMREAQDLTDKFSCEELLDDK